MGYDFCLEDRDSRVTPTRGGATLERALHRERPFELEIDGQRLQAALEHGARPGEYFIVVDGCREPLLMATHNDVHFIHWRGRARRVEAWNALDRARQAAIRAGGAEEIRAPMPGVVISVAVQQGAAVERGELLLTIESMKLQTAITASHAARVTEVCVAAGDHFDQGSPLVRLEALAVGAAGAAADEESRRS